MKLNKISMMLAATALVSCSDDFSERFTNQALEDSRMIELGSGFVLSGVGQEDAATRTHWEKVDAALVNNFLPVYGTPAPAANANLGEDENLVLEKVGLCWLGQTPNENVYTNYEFYHFGWLNNDQTEADVQCEKLVNGAWYTDLQLNAAGTPGEEADVSNLVYTTLSGKTGTVSDNLNLNTGVYKTDNKSIFGGDYIVYYPFNEDFKEAGTIPAIAQTKFYDAPTSYDDPALGKATFRYSGKTTINGGDQAAGFGMYNLSSLVRVNVLSDDCSDDIDQIVLYSENEELLSKANLAADKIVAGTAKGEALYASREGTKTIVATLGSPAQITDTKNSTAKVFITALPTTVEDLVVLVHNSSNGTWASVDMGEITFPAGSAQTLNVEVKAVDFTTDYIAVDEVSLSTALNEARSVAVDAESAQTITVIGDIELSNTPNTPDPKYINVTNDEFITIQGGAIIVPEDVTLTVNTNMLSDIKVLGKSCCDGTEGGKLVVEGGLISNVTMEPTKAKATTDALYDQYNPTLTYQTYAATVPAGSKVDVQAGNVVVNAPVEYRGELEVAPRAKVTVNGSPAVGKLQFYDANISNNGTIEVMKNGVFNVLNANGSTTAIAGKKMTNNGYFIHNIDASVGGATQFMNQNGEYRCKVDVQEKLNDAYDLWTACSVIEMVQTVNNTTYNLNSAKQHNNKYVDIEVNPTSGLTTKFINPSASVNIGNLTVKSRLEITYTKAGTGASDLTVNGNCVSDANFVLNTIRDFKVTRDMTVNNGWVSFKASNSIDITGNLTLNGDGSSQLNYYDGNSNLKVGKDITVNKAKFITQPKAMNVSCANFYLQNAAEATFSNRISGTTMTVSGMISNPDGCTFTIVAANTNPTNGLIADITCTTLVEGGNFTNGKPRVVE